MESIENEKLILESDNRQIMLTSHRLRYHESTSKNSNFISLMLDKISSIELTYQSNIWLLIIGIITIPLIIGIVFIIQFFTTKRHVVSIIPDGGKPIVFETKGMKRDYLEDFINKVEDASFKLRNK